MKHCLRSLLALGCLCSLLLVPLERLPAQAAENSTTAADAARTPKPYGADEFPLWAQDLRRFEVITIGSWPISFLFSNLLFDVGRWSLMSIAGDSDAAGYAPLFFAPADKPANTDEETLVVVGISIGISLAIGLIDHFLEVERREREAEHQAYLRAELFRNSTERSGVPDGEGSTRSAGDAAAGTDPAGAGGTQTPGPADAGDGTAPGPETEGGSGDAP